MMFHAQFRQNKALLSTIFTTGLVLLSLCDVTDAWIPFTAQLKHTKANTRLSSLYASPKALQGNKKSTSDENTNESTFESLGLSYDSLQAVNSQPSWVVPTPVQQLAIPRLLADGKKKDLESFWCEAPTGSGKTAAFALPLLQRLQEQTRAEGGEAAKISSLILCPTRELAVQITQVIQSLSSHMTSPRRGRAKNWRIQVIHGGVPLEPQIGSLARCVDEGLTIDVLVATPGRMVDVLTRYKERNSSTEAALEARLMAALDEQGKSDTSLSLSQIQDLDLDRIDDDGRAGLEYLLEGIDYVVLDEADRLLSRAFETEVNAVLDLLPTSEEHHKKGHDLQTWLFSATFPKQIEPRVDSVLKRLGHTKPPIRIISAQSDRILESEEDISGSLKKKLDRATTAKSSKQQVQIGAASTIKLRAIKMEKRDRTQVLRRLLETNPWDRVLVFVATRYASEHVARKLRRVGIESAELHGKLDQDARMRRLKAFASGRVRVLLATDVASRGLDVVGLPAVVNYDLPRSTADFVHRVGRTGRAGRKGTAISFVTPTSEAQLDLIEQRHLQEPIVREVLPGFEIDEEQWLVQSAASRISAEGVTHSSKGLAHDRMHGGIKGHRRSKKDRLREKAAREAAEAKKSGMTAQNVDSVEDKVDAPVQASASEDSSSSPSRDDLMSLTVVQLKEKLRADGKPVSGNKGELVDRLLA
mmetsp:Transcript_10574/g.16279  ORF Transcript_10574/g.16279 Transcript_10574/m.16279 type:complete len:701 (-) Transcript_10574:1337-3439(-)